MREIRIRAATPADAAALAIMHVASWRETYTGIMPAELLAEQSVDARTAMWIEILRNREAAGCIEVFVAEDAGRIIAFGSCGLQRDRALADAGLEGEIGGLYVLQSHQGRGIGRSIMAAMSGALSGLGYTGVSLWVLRDNPTARAFYERLGGEIVGEKRFKEALVEIAYGWSDVARLTR